MLLQHKAQRTDNGVLITLVDLGKSQEFKCSLEQYDEGMDEYMEGSLIQHAFQFLSEDEREFLLSGLNAEEWEELHSEKGGSE